MTDLNRNGQPFNWPEQHAYGRLERAVDSLAFELRKVPPYIWLKWILDKVS